MNPADRTLLLATSNRHKVIELAEMLAAEAIHLLCLADLPPVPAPEETATTFLGNARLKAIYYAQVTKLPALADDSGIEVDRLGGEPGVRSARYAGGAGDEANNRLLLERLAGVPAAERSARFRAALVIALPDGTIAAEAEGVVEGRVDDAPRGEHGFGYDPLFVPHGHRLSFGQLPPEIKRGISHRTDALAKLRPQITRLFKHAPSRP